MLITIEKLIYGGDGLARLSPDDKGRSKAVFIPFVLSGEQVEAAITAQKPSFARARATAIPHPSPYRVAPPCPHFGRCGGCHYQHASYDHQLELKREILRENLRRIAKVELKADIVTHPSPPWNYRNRSRLQLRTRPDFAVGYFRFGSHDLLPVENCPISSPLINRGIAALWTEGRAGKVVEGLREVEFFANADDTQLLLEFVCAAGVRRAELRSWCEEFSSRTPGISGIVVFREGQQGTPEYVLTVGAGDLTYKTSRSDYRVSAGSFFQINRFLIDELVGVVTKDAAGELALDLYAGGGLFSTVLARDVGHIVCVETSQISAGDLKYNLPVNAKAVQKDAKSFLSEFARSQTANGKALPLLPKRPDLVVLDPPRGGLEIDVAQSVADVGASRITYVSCDPATLARDLVTLIDRGYKVEVVHLFDLFPQTFHIESVVKLTR